MGPATYEGADAVHTAPEIQEHMQAQEEQIEMMLAAVAHPPGAPGLSTWTGHRTGPGVRR